MITLKFTSLEDLLDFAMTINVIGHHLNKPGLLLKCELTEKEIELAENGFNANVVNTHNNIINKLS